MPTKTSYVKAKKPLRQATLKYSAYAVARSVSGKNSGEKRKSPTTKS